MAECVCANLLAQAQTVKYHKNLRRILYRKRLNTFGRTFPMADMNVPKLTYSVSVRVTDGLSEQIVHSNSSLMTGVFIDPLQDRNRRFQARD
jgi:hypothetical protein